MATNFVDHYEFRQSSIEVKSLNIFRIRTRNGNLFSEDMGMLYRYQGEFNGNPVYRDIDGNFKPLEDLTIDYDCF